MTNEFDTLLLLLPEELRKGLSCLPQAVKQQVHEIRLRSGQAVAVSIGGAERYVAADGMLTEFAGGALHCTAAWLRMIVDRACEQSVYAHQEELRQGYLPAPSGCRIGVAGTAVVEHGRIISYRQITSLCLRIAREHRGCAHELAQRLCEDGVSGALICGEPSSGKTSLLRDLIREFSTGGISVAVIDERGELTGGCPLPCDVLRGAPKAAGIEQALRCLAPRVIVFDELGGADEVQALHTALACGVPVVASAHARQLHSLLYRRGMTEALRSGAFSWLVQLRGVTKPGEVSRVIRTEEWLRERTRDAAVVVDGAGIGAHGRA